MAATCAPGGGISCSMYDFPDRILLFLGYQCGLNTKAAFPGVIPVAAMFNFPALAATRFAADVGLGLQRGRGCHPLLCFNLSLSAGS